MDVLRHTGRAQLSSFVGGSAGNREMDRTQWALAPYTEADLQRQIDRRRSSTAPRASSVRQRPRRTTSPGINAYIAEAQHRPDARCPPSTRRSASTPSDWKVTDVIATASLIGGIFGKGGGNELRLGAGRCRRSRSASARKKGRRAWADFRSKNDPEAPTTVLKKRFPYETDVGRSPSAGLALPDPGSVTFAPVAPAGARAARRADAHVDRRLGAELRRRSSTPHASNWELVSARKSRHRPPDRRPRPAGRLLRARRS